MGKTDRQFLTDEQNRILTEAVKNHISPGKVFKIHDFGDMKLRTFYRRYREMAISLGMYKPVNSWSEDDETYLKSLSDSEVIIKGEYAGHSLASIRRKRQKMGLTTRNLIQAWTEEDDDRLKMLSQTMTASEIFDSDELPGRSLAAIYGRIKNLGIDGCKKKKPWSKEEVELLLRMSASDVSIRDMCEILKGRSLSSVQTKLGYLKKPREHS